MTGEQEKIVFDVLNVFLKGSQEAVEYCQMLYKVAHLWDDLIDKDKPVQDADINKAFITLFVSMPSNRFYREHMDMLIPLQYNAILQWLTANKMERMDLESKHKAFMLKASFLQIVHVCTGIIGGTAWAEEIGADLWNTLYGESLGGFLEEVQYA